MSTVVIVSKCTNVTTTLEDPLAEFSFKGTFLGQKLEGLALYHSPDMSFEVGVEYVLYVQVDDVHEGHLLGTIIKSKKMEEIA